MVSSKPNNASKPWKMSLSTLYWCLLWEEPCKPAISYSKIIRINPKFWYNLIWDNIFNPLVTSGGEWSSQWSSSLISISLLYKIHKRGIFISSSMKLSKIAFSQTYKTQSGNNAKKQVQNYPYNFWNSGIKKSLMTDKYWIWCTSLWGSS
jgi:hypothetical protein